MAHQSTGIDVPDDRHVVALEEALGRLAGAPIRRQRRKFAHDECFDVWPGRFLIVEIGADVSDVRVSEADDLPGIAWVGENFLIASEAGVKNDFAATTGARARRAAAKDPSVFEREGRASCVLRQCALPKMSFRCC